jgi:hypothetical protein
MSTYKYVKNEMDEAVSTVKVTDSGFVKLVPMNTDNADYVQILKQVADGDIIIAEAD